MRKSTTNQPSQRMLRVAEQIKEILAEYFMRGHFHSPELITSGALVTVTEVKVSPDLKHAAAYVIAHGHNDMKGLISALNDESFFMQKELNRQTSLKFTPKLSFREDEIFDKAMKLDSIINNLKYSENNE